jgi:hypothetical protein
MSLHDQDRDRTILPKPIALRPDQLRQIAAGTVAALPAISLRPIIAGPLTVGPEWLSYIAAE